MCVWQHSDVSCPTIYALKRLVFFSWTLWKKRYLKMFHIFIAWFIVYYIKTYSVQEYLSNHIHARSCFNLFFYKKNVQNLANSNVKKLVGFEPGHKYFLSWSGTLLITIEKLTAGYKMLRPQNHRLLIIYPKGSEK